MKIQLSDNQFIILLVIWFVKTVYIMIGLYYFYPEVLNMLFWPFHYGWLSH